jgi:DNA-binding transcriptional regulator YiaG
MAADKWDDAELIKIPESSKYHGKRNQIGDHAYPNGASASGNREGGGIISSSCTSLRSRHNDACEVEQIRQRTNVAKRNFTRLLGRRFEKNSRWRVIRTECSHPMKYPTLM